MFVLCVGVLLYRVYRYVQLLCLPLGLIQEEMKIMNKPITSNKVKALIKNLWKTKTQETESFTGELNQTFREELMSTFWNLFQKFQGSNTSRLITQAAITFIWKPEKDKATKGRRKKRKKEKENYRPITLQNMDGKVLNKTLANRIQQHNKNPIHHDQVGFIPGMQEFVNICKSNNVIHHLKIER